MTKFDGIKSGVFIFISVFFFILDSIIVMINLINSFILTHLYTKNVIIVILLTKMIL